MTRLKPSFFIIGERKCGTSSLYRYLVSHPNVLPCKIKEPNFFSQPLWKILLGYQKYLSLFPNTAPGAQASLDWIELDKKGRIYKETISQSLQPGIEYITGEASVNTFYYGNPKVIKHFLPKVKLILMLRNPTERTFSHYRMLQRFKAEGRKTIPLTNFETDLKMEITKVRQGQKSAFLSPSLYIQTLPKWLKVFGRENLRIIYTQNMLQTDTALEEMNRISQYLNLPTHSFLDVIGNRHNAAPAEEMSLAAREMLDEFLLPFNQELELVGIKF